MDFAQYFSIDGLKKTKANIQAKLFYAIGVKLVT